jgi:hypothetical protein
MKRIVVVAVFVCLAVSGGFIWSAKSRAQQSGAPVPPLPAFTPPAAPRVVPEVVAYRHLFHFVVAAQAKSVAVTARGASADLLADSVIASARLNAAQMQTLATVAAECERQTNALDAEAKPVIEAYRAAIPNGGAPPAELPPIPPQLADLQKRRDAAVLAGRDALRAGLGDAEFNRFQTFVATDFAQRISAISPGRLPAAPSRFPSNATGRTPQSR